MAVGQGAAALHGKAEDLLTRALVKGRNPDLDALLRPQTPDVMSDHNALGLDDMQRNQRASSLSDSILQDQNATPSLKAAAEAFKQNPNSFEAWKPLADSMAGEQKLSNFREAKDALAIKIGGAAAKARQFGSDVKDVYDVERSRQNAQSTGDAHPLFDKVLANHLFNNRDYRYGDAPDDFLGAAASVRQWIQSGFKGNNGKFTVPPELRRIFTDPAQGIENAYNLMKQQGLVTDDKQGKLLTRALELTIKGADRESSDAKVVEKNLVPTAKHEFGDIDHGAVADAIKRQIADGKLNEALMDRLFGPNKDAALEALNPKREHLTAEGEERTGVHLSDEGGDVHEQNGGGKEEVAGMTDAMHPNEVGSRVEYHHFNPATEAPYDAGNAVQAGHARNKIRSLEGANQSHVRPMGIVDMVRERHANDPLTQRREIELLKQKHGFHTAPEGSTIEGAAQHEATFLKNLNKSKLVLREEHAGDKGEPVDVHGKEFDAITPGAKKNVWAESTGKNNERAGPEHGTLFFERVKRGESGVDPETGEVIHGQTKTTQFATSTAKIIKRAREMKKAGAFTSEKNGLADQHDMLMSGISSLLNAKNDAGEHALTGRVGVWDKAAGEVKWLKKGESLPDNLKLHTDGAHTLGDARAQINGAVKRGLGKERTIDATKPEEVAQAKESAERTIDRAEKLGHSDLSDKLGEALADAQEHGKWSELHALTEETNDTLNSVGREQGGDTDTMVEKPGEPSKDTLQAQMGEPRARDEHGNEQLALPDAKGPGRNVLDTAVHDTMADYGKRAWIAKSLEKGVPAFLDRVRKLPIERQKAIRVGLEAVAKAPGDNNPPWLAQRVKAMLKQEFANVAPGRVLDFKKPAVDVGKQNRLAEIHNKSRFGNVEGMEQTSTTRGEAQTAKTLNVYWGSGENKELSNLAPRSFVYNGREYRSVEHAYQSLKSGKFDADAYARGKLMAKATGRMGTDLETNMRLMKDLIRESFAQNADASKKLLDTGVSRITHTQDTGVWREAFPKLLMEVREGMKQTSMTRVELPKTSPYAVKDQAKSDKATKFIGRGSLRSSTNAYAEAWGDRANTGVYTSSDKIFVSAEGARSGRKTFDKAELNKAISAGAILLTDDLANRQRAYNSGEREVADYLTEHGYVETKAGEWVPGNKEGRLNRQEPTMESEKRATPEEIQAANDHITKTLGPQMEREFLETLGGHSADWTPDAQGNVIRVATNAVGGVLSNAYHESMHEFFNRLVTGKQEGVAKLLTDVASNAIVKRSLERILAEHPEAIKSLSSPEERLSYAYQFWADGHPLMKLGPKAETFFGKVAKFLRNVTGLLRDDEKAEAMFRQFHEGNLQDASAAGEVLAKLNNGEKRVQAVVKVMEPFRRHAIDWVGSAEDNLLKSGNPHLEGVGKEFADTNNGYLQAADRSEKQWMGKLKEVLLPHEKDDIAAAVEGLQTGKLSSDPKIRAVQDGVRKVLDDMHPYLEKAGVSVFDEEKGWKPLGKRADYFPRSWNMEALAKDPEVFTSRLMSEHGDIMEKIAANANREVKELKGAGKRTASGDMLDKAPADRKEITAQDIANSIYNRLMGSNGQHDLGEDGYSLGYSPMMKAVNRRTLDFIDMAKFHEFQNKDLTNILSSYVMQATKRAEYTRRFGPDGRKIEAAMTKARDFEVDKKIAEQYGIKGASLAARAAMAADPTLYYEKAVADHVNVSGDKDGLSEKGVQALVEGSLSKLMPARRAVMAMEGTLGHDINPTLRKAQGWVLAYQNWRMLPMALFSNLIDPLGILVRGGTMDDTFAAYKNGMTDVVNSWRGKDREDNLTHMAEMIGTLDAHGYMSSMGTMMNSLYMSGGAKKMNDTLFRMNGMEALNRSMRGSATQAAIGFVKRHATQPNEHSERLLKEVGLDADYVKSKLTQDGGLDVTDPKIQNAVAQWVNEAILRPTSAQRPSRMSDPYYALISHFKGFMYSMYKQILQRAAKEARLGNYTAASTLALGYVPVMYAADMGKLIVQNALAGNAKLPAWWEAMDAKDHALYAAERAGLMGPTQILRDVVEYGPTAAVGPTAEQMAGLFTDPLGKSVTGAMPWSQFFASAQRAVTD